VRAGLLAGVVLVAVVHAPYARAAYQAVRANSALDSALAAVSRSDLATAQRLAAEASSHAPLSPRPWLTYGRALLDAGKPADALAAYQEADRRAAHYDESWVARAALPRLLRDAGRQDEADQALSAAQILSWRGDPWLVLEAAWRELPPPRTDEIRVGGDDYGAVRGFYHPRPAPEVGFAWARYSGDGPAPPPGPHRWTRQRAWLRLVPATQAPAYTVTIEMGSPFPSPLEAPQIEVRLNDRVAPRLRLNREIRSYSFPVTLPAGALLVVRIDAPTWSKPGEPAEQGVRIDSLRVEPTR